MKRILLAVCLSLMTIWSATVLAADNVGVVNMQTIFRSSPQIKQINAALKKKFSARKASIVELDKTLQAEVQKFQKNHSVMTPKSLQGLRAKISTQGLQLRQAQTKFQKDLVSEQNKQMRKFINSVRKIVRKIAMKKKLNLVLPSNSVLYASNNLDITSRVLADLK